MSAALIRVVMDDPAQVVSAAAVQVTVTLDGVAWPIEGAGGATAHSGLTGLTTGDDHTQYLNTTRGDARYPVLTGGLIPTSTLPALAITSVEVVANQATMLALSAQRGDVAVRTDTGHRFILSSDSPTTLVDWVDLGAPTDAVTTVNGQAGVVVLGASDVGADASGAAAAAEAAAIAASQPVDADLTAIALLSTTTYGRSLLTLAAASDLRTAAGTTNATVPTGAFYESMSRVEAVSAAAQTSGTLYMHSITLQPGQTITSITVLNGNTALSGHTNHWAGVWDSSRVCLAISPDATSAAWGSNSPKTFTMGTPYANPGATALQLYVGIMVAGTTTGNFISCNSMVSATVSVTPMFCATSTTGMTTPPSVGSTAGALSAATRRPWFWLA